MKKAVIGFSDSSALAKKIARQVKAKYSELELKKFPDGETYLRFKDDVKGKEVIFIESLNNPNEKIFDLILASHTAKELGAKKLTLVAPYMCYMRQDKRFNSGEAISSKIIGKLFHNFNKIITVDPHLHRYKSLKQVFSGNPVRLSANELISSYIKKNLKNVLIIGPDAESYQWAEEIAKHVKSHAIVLRKRRFNSRSVKIRLNNNVSLKGKDVVIVDDIISTGHTMIETVKEAKKHKAKNIYCIAVHGLNVENAYLKLKKLGVKKIIATNTIPGKDSLIDVSGLISESLK